MAGLCTAGVRLIGLLTLVPASAGVLLGFPRGGTGPGDLTAAASDGGLVVGFLSHDGINETPRLLCPGRAAVSHLTTPLSFYGFVARLPLK